MNWQINEYVQEVSTQITNQGFAVRYALLDYIPVGTLGGDAYDEEGNWLFGFSFSSVWSLQSPEDGIAIVSGGIQLQRQLFFTYSKDPGDHYLCVHYPYRTHEEFQPIRISNKINWIQEGF